MLLGKQHKQHCADIRLLANMESYYKAFSLQRYENIKKLEDDRNLYRGLILVNQMKVFLISDPNTEKSSCTLSVDVGSFYDPHDLPGLAHLCERTLVLGTEKYPSYKEFYKFVSDHGGSYRGTTKTEETYYYFEIDPNHFKDALIQYVHFFVTPLFKEDWIKKEIDTVDSDHKHILMNDYNRLDEFIKFTERHMTGPSSFRNTKSLSTLLAQSWIDVRSRLLDFYEKYYSANNMSLCVLTNDPLDKIEEMVAGLFCMIPNKKKIKEIGFLRRNSPSIFRRSGPSIMGQFCTAWYIVPRENVKSLKIIFPLPPFCTDWILATGESQREMEHCMAVNFFIALLTYDGKGSLHAHVKESRLFGDNYNINIYYESYAFLKYLIFDIYLTENNVLNKQMAFIELLFEYFNMIKKECNVLPPSDTLLELYERFINKVDYDFKTSSYYASTWNIAGKLHVYACLPMEDVILKDMPRVFQKSAWQCSQKIIMSILNNYVSPRTIRIYMVAQEYEHHANKISPEWCGGAKYKQDKIPEDVISRWENISNSKFHLPTLDGWRNIIQSFDFK